MQRAIVGFHQDEAGDWVAELDCGHRQHVRHRPPFTLRPWVTTPEGRVSRLGVELACVRCDRSELPEQFAMYKQTPEFDEASIPVGLTQDHSTKAGVWGVIRVVSGRLRYIVDGMDGRETIVSPGAPGIVVPQVVHHVASAGPVRFRVEFWRNQAAPERADGSV